MRLSRAGGATFAALVRHISPFIAAIALFFEAKHRCTQTCGALRRASERRIYQIVAIAVIPLGVLIVPIMADFVNHSGIYGTVVRERAVGHADISSPEVLPQNVGISTPTVVAKDRHPGEGQSASAFLFQQRCVICAER